MLNHRGGPTQTEVCWQIAPHKTDQGLMTDLAFLVLGRSTTLVVGCPGPCEFHSTIASSSRHWQMQIEQCLDTRKGGMSLTSPAMSWCKIGQQRGQFFLGRRLPLERSSCSHFFSCSSFAFSSASRFDSLSARLPDFCTAHWCSMLSHF